jgi:hypothetical protein
MSQLEPTDRPESHLAQVAPAQAQAAAVPVPAPSTNPPAGWYDDGSGRQRWFDGIQWTDHYNTQSLPTRTAGPMTAQQLNVKREVSYVRQQQGHSIILHVFLGMFVLWINVIYISVSPNHYWHA